MPLIYEIKINADLQLTSLSAFKETLKLITYQFFFNENSILKKNTHLSENCEKGRKKERCDCLKSKPYLERCQMVDLEKIGHYPHRVVCSFLFLVLSKAFRLDRIKSNGFKYFLNWSTSKGLLLFKGQFGTDKSELGANCAYYLSRARNYHFEQGERWGWSQFVYRYYYCLGDFLCLVSFFIHVSVVIARSPFPRLYWNKINRILNFFLKKKIMKGHLNLLSKKM